MMFFLSFAFFAVVFWLAHRGLERESMLLAWFEVARIKTMVHERRKTTKGA